MDMCRMFGEYFRKGADRGSLKWHVRYKICNIPVERWVVPDGKAQCVKCKVHVHYDHKSKHERKCKGSKEANTTCSKCGRNDFVLQDSGLSIEMGQHEYWCTGSPSNMSARAKAAAAVQAPAEAVAKAPTVAKAAPVAGKAYPGRAAAKPESAKAKATLRKPAATKAKNGR